MSESVVKIVVTSVNPGRLGEELAAAALLPPIIGVSWAGFFPAAPDRYDPNATSLVIGTTSSGGTTVEDRADPGELRFIVTVPLTPEQDAALDALLAAHDARTLSAEQVRARQDAADLATLLAARDAYLAHMQNWAGYDQAQVKAAAKECFVILGTAMRIMLRRELGAAI